MIHFKIIRQHRFLQDRGRCPRRFYGVSPKQYRNSLLQKFTD
jgi:hypothetical protein